MKSNFKVEKMCFYKPLIELDISFTLAGNTNSNVSYGIVTQYLTTFYFKITDMIYNIKFKQFVFK